jgi:hypothetical protein
VINCLRQTSEEEAMARFFINIKNGDEVLSDEEGIDLASVDDAKEEALRSARDLLCFAIKAGKPTVPEAFVITDETGRALETVPLAVVLPTSLRK